MKINPKEWKKLDETSFQAIGRVLLRSSAPFAVAVKSGSSEVAMEAKPVQRFALSKKATVTIIGGDAAVYRHIPSDRVVKMKGEKFTNTDRLPQESGSVAAVTSALRLLRLEERARVRRIREERQKLVEDRKRSEQVVDSQVEAQGEPKPKAKADPAVEPEGGAA